MRVQSKQRDAAVMRFSSAFPNKVPLKEVTKAA